MGISHGKGVVLCNLYEEMMCSLFARLVRHKFHECLALAAKTTHMILQDNDPRQNSAVSLRALSAVGAVRVRIPPRSPDLNPTKNIFHIAKQQVVLAAIQGHMEHET